MKKNVTKQNAEKTGDEMRFQDKKEMVKNVMLYKKYDYMKWLRYKNGTRQGIEKIT